MMRGRKMASAAANYAIRVIVSKPLVGEYHIQHEKVDYFSRGKRYLEQEAHKKRKTVFKCNLKLFLNALDRGKNQIGCWVEKKNIFFTSKYFTAGMNMVPEHAVHQFDLENTRVPLFVFIAKTDMIPQGLQLHAFSIPNNVDLLTNCFQLFVVRTEHVLLPGTVYFFYTPSHCHYKFSVQNYDEWRLLAPSAPLPPPPMPPMHYRHQSSTATGMMTIPVLCSLQQQMDIMMSDISECVDEDNDDQQQMEQTINELFSMEPSSLVPSDFLEMQMEVSDDPISVDPVSSDLIFPVQQQQRHQQQMEKIIIDPVVPDQLFASELSSPVQQKTVVKMEQQVSDDDDDPISVQQQRRQQQMDKIIIDPVVPDQIFASEPSSPVQQQQMEQQVSDDDDPISVQHQFQQQRQQMEKIIIDPVVPDQLFASEPSSPVQQMEQQMEKTVVKSEPSSPVQLFTSDQFSVQQQQQQQQQQQMEQVSKPVILTFDSEFDSISHLFPLVQQQQQQMGNVKVESSSSSSSSSEFLAVTSDNELFPEVNVEAATTTMDKMMKNAKDFNLFYNKMFMCNKATMTDHYCILDHNESVQDQIRQLELQLHALYEESKKIKSY